MRRSWASLRARASSKRRNSWSTSSVKMRRSCTSTRPPRKWATPMAMPGDAPTPANLIIDDALAESVVHQGTQGGHRVLGVGPLGLDDDAQPAGRHQGQQPHDALAVRSEERRVGKE